VSQELLYTSAPAGLNPSDQGFCTVACTQGMPRNLKEVLENLSGYRQAEEPPHPVNYSHLIHTVGGKRYQILSRVGDYEKDYSGRTNKLAHHVALTVDELPPSGPAALLSNSVCQSAWDGETRWIQGGPALPVASAYRGPCRHWESLAGDAGWAGILAESAADGSNRPMYVIFPQGEEMLPLASEALGILPPAKAWTTSFSTYFTKLPAGVDCLWRFVVDGSPEAQAARSAGHGRVIDLVELGRSRRRAPDGNPYVQAARAGKVIDAPPMAASMTFAASAAATATAPEAAPPTPSESAVPESPFATAAKAPASPFGPSRRQQQLSSKMVMTIAGIAVVLFIGVGTLVYSMLTRDIPKPIDQSLAEDDREKPIQKKTNKEFLSPTEKARREDAKKTQQKAQVKLVAPPPMEVVKNDTPPPMPKDEIKGPWDRSLKSLGGNLKLPDRKPSLISNAQEKPQKAVLAEIHVADPHEIDLEILSPNGSSKEIGKEGSKREGFILEPPEDPDEDDQIRKWVVKRQSFLMFQPEPRKEDVGTFTLKDQQLIFEWNMQANLGTTKALSLPYCLLEISRGDKTYQFQLSEPKKVAPLTYDFASPGKPLQLDVNTNAVDGTDKWNLDLFVETDGEKPNNKLGLKHKDSVSFSLVNPSQEKGDAKVELEISFQVDVAKGPQIVVNAITSRKHLKPLTSSEAQQKLENVPVETLSEPTIITDFAKYKKQANKNKFEIEKYPRNKEAIEDLPKFTGATGTIENSTFRRKR
jgi:hypothetical protein